MKAVLASLVLLPAIAAADVVVVSGAPGSGQAVTQPFVPTIPAAPAKPKKLGIEARQDVAASNRGLAAATAITVPEGQVEATLQSVVPVAGLIGLNAGLTKSTEVWVEAGGVLDFGDDGGGGGHEFGVGIKQSLLRTSRVALALTASARRFSGSGGESLGGIGAVGTLCVDDDCGLEVSAGLQRMFGFHESDYDSNGPGENLITLSASMGTPTTRLIVEAMSIDGDSLGFLGVRLGSKTVAVDLALVTFLEDYDSELPAIPWIGLTGRM